MKKRLAVFMLCLVLSGLLTRAVFARANAALRREAVFLWAAARDIRAGEELQEKDLQKVAFYARSLAALDAGLEELAGKVAIIDIPRHTPVGTNMVEHAGLARPGERLYVTRIEPVPGLKAGDRVDVIYVPGRNIAGSPQVVAHDVRVKSASPRVALVVNSETALALAGFERSGDLVLVLKAR